MVFFVFVIGMVLLFSVKKKWWGFWLVFLIGFGVMMVFGFVVVFWFMGGVVGV